MSNSDFAATMYEADPVVAALNKVPGFDPLKLLNRRRAPGAEKDERILDFRYKKLWFRLAHRQGRIRLNRLSITEQFAIIEAQVYFEMTDTNPVSSFTATCTREEAGEKYIENAQINAMDQALTDAGFGLQFVPAPVNNAGGMTQQIIPASFANTQPSGAASNVVQAAVHQSVAAAPVIGQQKQTAMQSTVQQNAMAVQAAAQQYVTAQKAAVQKPVQQPVTAANQSAMKQQAVPVQTNQSAQQNIAAAQPVNPQSPAASQPTIQQGASQPYANVQQAAIQQNITAHQAVPQNTAVPQMSAQQGQTVPQNVSMAAQQTVPEQAQAASQQPVQAAKTAQGGQRKISGSAKTSTDAQKTTVKQAAPAPKQNTQAIPASVSQQNTQTVPAAAPQQNTQAVPASMPQQNVQKASAPVPQQPSGSSAASVPPTAGPVQPGTSDVAAAMSMLVGKQVSDPALAAQSAVNSPAPEVSAGKVPETTAPAGHNAGVLAAAESAVSAPAEGAAPAAKAVKPYTETTPIEEILQHMTLEDAKAMVVPSGTCRGWTLEQVAERRKPSLKFYVSEGFQGGDNIFRAAARLMLNEVEKEAG